MNQPESSSQSAKTLFQGTSIVALLTLLSRALGFLRDLLMANVIGAGALADAFFVAFRVPNILRSFVAEGALTSAFVPVFTDELNHGAARAQQLLRSMLGLLLATTLLLSGLGILFADHLVALFAPGFSAQDGRATLAISLLRIMMPYILFVSLVALLNGALNSVKIFGAAAFAQVAMNIVMICGILLSYPFDEDSRVYIIAWSVIAGGIAQIVVQVPALSRSGFPLLPSARLVTTATKRVLVLMVPAIFGAAVYQLSIIINTILASLLREGSVSWLFYADRIAQLPIGVFTVALASVLLPTLSQAASKGDDREFARGLVNALRYVSFLLIPFAVGLFLLATPIVQLLFERGAFRETSTAMTSLALMALATGLWSISCQTILARACIARKDTVTPTLIGIVTLLIGFLTSVTLMGPIVSSNDSLVAQSVASIQSVLSLIAPLPNLGHVGLAFATAVSSVVAVIIYLVLLHQRESELSFSPFLQTTIRALLASTAMGAGIQLIVPSSLAPALSIASAVLIGVAIFYAVSYVLRTKEIGELTQMLRRRFL